MSAEDEVRGASKRFYTALTRMAKRNNGTIADISSRNAGVTAMHPIGGRQVGWDTIRDSFDQVGGSASDGEIKLRDQLIHLTGVVAYEIGIEYGEFKLDGQKISIDHPVTNIYRRENEGWKIVHHQADASLVMIDARSRLQTAVAKARR
jgi:ketosteroid isomerase-like protein